MQMTAALDNFESEDEAEVDLSEGHMEPAGMEPDPSQAAMEAGSLSLSATGHSRDNDSSAQGAGEEYRTLRGGPRGKRDALKAAGGRAKRVKVEAAEKSPQPAVAEELVLDAEYVMGVRNGQGHGAIASCEPEKEGWEAGAASKIRLLARMQAYQSLRLAQGSHAVSREAEANACTSLVVRSSGGTAPSLAAVDELSRVFEAAHRRLGLHVEQAG